MVLLSDKRELISTREGRKLAPWVENERRKERREGEKDDVPCHMKGKRLILFP